MKNIVVFLLISIVFSVSVFSQETLSSNSDNDTLLLRSNKLNLLNYQEKNIEKINKHDWFFFPFSLHIHSGIWMPLGKMSEYYKPCIQVGFGLGLMISKKVRIEYTIVPRFMINKKKVSIIVNDTITKTNNPMSGSIGGIVLYDIYKNKHVFLELFSGLAWEPLDTEIENPTPKNSKDKMMTISTMSFSLGSNIWVNMFGKHNVGLRTIYNYAFYNRAKILKSEIGGHSLSIALIYMFPKRNDTNSNYY